MTELSDADTVVRCYLAGWLDEVPAARELEVDITSFRAMMQDFGLAGKAMAPFAIDRAHSISFADIGGQDFNLPRFDDIIDGLRELPPGSRPLCYPLDISDLPNGLKPATSALPQGLIFHVGRCGSTLLSVLLGELLNCATIKEPEILNHLLARRLRTADTDGAADEALLRSMQSFASAVRRASGVQKRDCLIKMTSWNLLPIGDLLDRLDSLRAILLVRDPISTVTSMVANPPGWYFSSLIDASLPVDEMVRLFATEWVNIVNAALRLKTRPLIIDYDDLMRDPLRIVDAVADHCRMARPSAEQGLAATAPILGRYVKSSRHEHYDPDGRHKRTGLSQANEALVRDLTFDTWHEVGKLS